MNELDCRIDASIVEAAAFRLGELTDILSREMLEGAGPYENLTTAKNALDAGVISLDDFGTYREYVFAKTLVVHG